jgi:hypothetical protein
MKLCNLLNIKIKFKENIKLEIAFKSLDKNNLKKIENLKGI